VRRGTAVAARTWMSGPAAGTTSMLVTGRRLERIVPHREEIDQPGDGSLKNAESVLGLARGAGRWVTRISSTR